MSELMGIDSGSEQAPAGRATPPRRARRAWWALAGLPVSFVAATLLGGWLIAWQGHDPDGEETLPLLVVAIAGVPSTLVLLAPAIAAVLLGRSAERHGEPGGRGPVVAGSALIGLALVQGILAVAAR